MCYKVGPYYLNINSTDKGISAITFIETPSHLSIPQNEIIHQCIEELEEYFNGQRNIFIVPIDIVKGTDFQRLVWSSLLEVPYGEICSYKEIGSKINRPKAYQAIGQACKNNPVPILIPCHRVISQSGKLTGYFGTSSYGLSIKKELIALEKGNQQ